MVMNRRSITMHIYIYKHQILYVFAYVFHICTPNVHPHLCYFLLTLGHLPQPDQQGSTNLALTQSSC